MTVVPQPTKYYARGWVVNPVESSNPWWLALAAGLPALLATILIFMDQQITAVIVNRKENKLVVSGVFFFKQYRFIIIILVSPF